MLHNIEEAYHCEYTPSRPMDPEKDYLLAYSGNQILFYGETLPKICEVSGVDREHLRFLFTVSGVGFYRSEVPVSESEQLRYDNTRRLRTMSPQWLAFAGVTGYHLDVWYRNNRYCGVCATEYTHKADERALVCPNCGHTLYPNISVAVIVGITRGDEILVSRYAGRAPGSYSLIAGYVEIGESLFDTIRREVYEEVGLEVENIRYFDNQPWGFSQSMLVGFFADLKGSGEIHIDENELGEARWMRREDLIPRDSDISLTATMMEAFRRGDPAVTRG